MHRLTSLAGLLLPLIVAAACQQRQPVAAHPPSQQAPTGVFVGLDEMKGYPAEKPGDKWYHENIVYIRPDSLFLEGNPIVIHPNGEKSYSASDGGFYSFSGRIDTVGGKLVAQLRMFAHDYIAPAIIIKDSVVAANPTLNANELVKHGLAREDSSFYKRTFILTLTPKGFKMNNVHYVPTALDTSFALTGFPDAQRFFGQAYLKRQ